jgi:hypothetical protein
MKAVFSRVKTPKDVSWAMKVNWTEPALEDLEEIQVYIAKDSNFLPGNLLNVFLMPLKRWKLFPK